MNLKWFVLLWVMLLAVPAMSNQEEQPDEKRRLTAVRITEAPKIDGVLDEAVWDLATPADSFVGFDPFPGRPCSQHTEVRVLYDNTSIYIGAKLFDTAPDSILRQFSQRDEDATADVFGMMIDTYDDDQNAFAFMVTAAGVPGDQRWSVNGDDGSWNAVWWSEVNITDEGWVVEWKIPFSAIRFPNTDVQSWGLNFFRRVHRYRSMNTWQEIDPAIGSWVLQAGYLDGIENIKSPVRLAFYPYVSSYLEHSGFADEETSPYSTSFNGGMDLKYGINDAFTLDVTLIPDFGQVQSDNQVLNLSPFEIRFNENRQFFTEGTEIYNKGDLFYSRRVGGRPVNYFNVYDELDDDEEIVSNPEQSQLLNASKVSGRTAKGLGIGVFNGVTKPMYATVRNEAGEEREILTDPLTNYNVFVLDQNLKNNSFITFVNTNVMRAGATYDANVSGLLTDLYDKNNKYNVWAEVRASQKYGQEYARPEIGWNYSVGFGKVSGNFTWELWQSTEDEVYDPNDLGFLFNNNSDDFGGSISYNIYEPKGRMLRMWSDLSFYYSRLHAPSLFADFNINPSIGMTLDNFLAMGVWSVHEPFETYDYFESRVWGRKFTWQTSNNVGAWISSNYANELALDVNVNYRFWKYNRDRLNVRVGVRYRPSDKLMFILNTTRNDWNQDEGAAILEDGSVARNGEEIIFGKRDQLTYENTLSINYIFTNTMGLTFRLRHYWSTVDYDSYHRLGEEDGYLYNTDYIGADTLGNSLHNTTFDAFNIDMVYRWVFAPGSELSVVWKNSIFKSDNSWQESYFDNLQETLESPQINSFSIKLLYFIDYLSLQKKSP